MCVFKTSWLYVVNTTISGPEHIFSDKGNARPLDTNTHNGCCHWRTFLISQLWVSYDEA